MNGFERRKQKKRKDILSAAFDLFRKNGIDAVKITDIAKEANVSKVSIYNYFESKDELARQVMFEYMDRKAEELTSLLCSELSFKEKYEIMYTVNMNSVNELTDGQTEGLMDNNMLADPRVQQFLHTYAETKIKPLFIEFIEQGKREGVINSELATETILMYIQAFNGILSSPLTVKQRVDLGELFFNGFKGK